MTDPEHTPCQHDGCDRPGFECRNLAVDEAEFPPEYYCDEHAVEHGFCCACGSFNAGHDGFDIIHRGYCDNCWDEVINDQFDDDDFEDSGWVGEDEDEDEDEGEVTLDPDDIEDPEYREAYDR
jgi:hypothetical protein